MMTTTLAETQTQALPKLPQLTFWQCMWDTLGREGWQLDHYTFQNGEEGSSHMVRARRKGNELICSAPSMSLAVQVIYNQRMCAEAA